MIADPLLEPPLFPDRSWIDDAARRRAEETPLAGSAGTSARRGTIWALEVWVRGGSFHRYGARALDALVEDLGVEDAVAEMGRWPGELKVEGTLRSGGIGMYWHAWYRRAGGMEGEYGGCSGYSTPEDAAYVCLHTIEQHEREAYLERLVVGVA